MGGLESIKDLEHVFRWRPYCRGCCGVLALCAAYSWTSTGPRFRWSLNFAGAPISLGLDFTTLKCNLLPATIRILSVRVFRGEGHFPMLHLPFKSRESAILPDIPVPLRLGRLDALMSDGLGPGLSLCKARPVAPAYIKKVKSKGPTGDFIIGYSSAVAATSRTCVCYVGGLWGLL
jgi:hypothetical protein